MKPVAPVSATSVTAPSPVARRPRREATRAARDVAKRRKRQRDQHRPGRERGDAHGNRGPEQGGAGERRQGEVEAEDAGDDLRHGEAVGERLMVEVLPVGLPDPLAAEQTAQQGQGGVGEVVEGEEEGGGPGPRSGELQQRPADEQAQGQRAHVTEEEPRHRLVEGSEAEKPAKQGGGEERRGRRQAAHDAEEREGGCDGHELGHAHPVDPVHEVDEVHEPDPGEDQGRRSRRLPAGPGGGGRPAPPRAPRRPPRPPGRRAGCRAPAAGGRPRRRGRRGPSRRRARGRGRARRGPESPAPAVAKTGRADHGDAAPWGVGVRWLERAFGRASA